MGVVLALAKNESGELWHRQGAARTAHAVRAAGFQAAPRTSASARHRSALAPALASGARSR